MALLEKILARIRRIAAVNWSRARQSHGFTIAAIISLVIGGVGFYFTVIVPDDQTASGGWTAADGQQWAPEERLLRDRLPPKAVHNCARDDVSDDHEDYHTYARAKIECEPIDGILRVLIGRGPDVVLGRQTNS